MLYQIPTRICIHTYWVNQKFEGDLKPFKKPDFLLFGVPLCLCVLVPTTTLDSKVMTVTTMLFVPTMHLVFHLYSLSTKSTSDNISHPSQIVWVQLTPPYTGHTDLIMYSNPMINPHILNPTITQITSHLLLTLSLAGIK